jgi:hypothetical protein
LVSERLVYLNNLMQLSAQDFIEDSTFFQNWPISMILHSITYLKLVVFKYKYVFNTWKYLTCKIPVDYSEYYLVAEYMGSVPCVARPIARQHPEPFHVSPILIMPLIQRVCAGSTMVPTELDTTPHPVWHLM